MGRIIVINGTSNTGKTTLCDSICKEIENIAIIPEASLFAKMHPDRYPKIPVIPQSADEEKENQKFFFTLELDRLIQANKIARLGKDVFMDRDVLDVLSVAYSFEDIKKWNGIYKNAEILYKKFIELANKNGIGLPEKYICLQADSEEIIRRNKTRQIERGKKLSETDWIEKSLINKQIEFFSKLCTKENEGRVHFIDTNNMTKREVFKSVCQLLNLKEKERERNDD